MTRKACFLISVILLFSLITGCERYVINQALEIEQDSQLTCIESATDRCALPSEFQDLADKTMVESEDSDVLHYASVLDIGEDELLARIHLIRAARESIILQTFIWDDDEIGQLVFMELLRAARRGVKVRMVLDQFGTYVKPRIMAAMETAHENIEIKLYRPIMRRGGRSITQDIGGAITDAKTLYRRMHNKLLAVDERIAIVSGRNIQDSYFDYGNKVNFKDLGILVIGPVVKDMYRSFELYWDSTETKRTTELYDIASPALKLTEEDRANLFDSYQLSKLRRVSQEADSYSIIEKRATLELYEVDRVEYTADWPDKRGRNQNSEEWNSTSRLGEIILQAEHSIQLETPYLIQNSRGIRTFKAFRKEKPDVEISLCTNSLASADMFFVWAIIFKQRQLYLETLDCRMYELRPVPGDVLTMMPRFTQIEADQSDETDLNEDPELLVPLEDYTGPRLVLHSKFFVVDKRISAAGSHNFDPRAKNLNTENMVIIWDEEVAEALSNIFERDTAPQNGWVLAHRQRPLGGVNAVVARISSSLPVFDVWPFDYSSNYDLIEGMEPVPSNHPDFYENYKSVGVFPEVGLSPNRLGVRFIRAFGGIFRGLM
ncbi:MAG: phospholipase D family protein [Planctomycetota bacterium]|jgi:phosphatidylserine/phosphatidylglycerophosphate/cardiolipin synthase-like enzyme